MTGHAVIPHPDGWQAASVEADCPAECITCDKETVTSKHEGAVAVQMVGMVAKP